MSPQDRWLTRGGYLSYASGALGTAGFGTVPGLLLSIYLTNTLGVAAGLAALVVLFPKLWDLGFLPFVGRLSDRSAARRGTRRPLLLVGALVLLVTFPFMFAVPESLGPYAAAAWVFVAFLVATSAFAFFQVPYIAMAAEITDSPAERTTLMSWRVAFQAAAILAFGVGAPVIRQSVEPLRAGYLVMGIVVAAAIAAGMLVCWWGLRHARRYVREGADQQHADDSLLDQFRLAWRARPFRMLLGAFFIQALATGATITALAYFSLSILGIEDFALLFGVLIVPAVIVMPAWNWFGHRYGKRAGYLTSSLFFIAGSLLVLMAPSVPLGLTVGCIANAAVGYAGMQMFPLAMLPDTIAVQAEESGEQRAGAFTGVWTAGETAAFAIGPALVLGLLALTGFVSSTDNSAVQPDSAVAGVLASISILPAALVALSLPLIAKWRLRDPEHSGASAVSST
ncbi:MAG: MFS transporter [bacterium]